MHRITGETREVFPVREFKNVAKKLVKFGRIRENFISKEKKKKIARKRYFYRPQRSWGKVMFFHVSVILFTGGRDLPHCMLGYTHTLGPEAGTPLPPRTRGRTPHPQEQTPPPPGSRPLPDQAPPRSRPPWDPPSAVHAGRYGQQAGGTHPIGMQSCS